ncbi:PilW family protein [Acinetobacter sp. R933-2]|uniref:PilW family protein n=1 Tax=Acinetobacter sp. R933-2 TaxID=2746728 RepID=UPI0025783157|nr:PilW family protein [Acinetobacter sp. R933-2]MDM1246065.1 PilW family protein [Acinetobacter sp. R933-2]
MSHIKQVGFTLIELMIALALGLVIVAAATMLFLTSSRSQALQQGQLSLQDDANFGLNYIVKDIRLGNLNTINSSINDLTTYGGIVFRSSENSVEVSGVERANIPIGIVGKTVNETLLTRSDGLEVGTSPQWTGVSNVQDRSSDQLTIQFVPQYVLDHKNTANENDDVWYGGSDCEGTELEFSRTEGRQVIVQRYFLRPDNNNSKNEPNTPLALACDAGHYPLEGSPNEITGLGDDGEIILQRVDHFRVLYSIQSGENHRYVDTATYMAMASRPRILAVQLGVLARSNQSVGTGTEFSDSQVFRVLDQDVTVTKPIGNSSKYARQVVTQTIALRNAFGERGQ